MKVTYLGTAAAEGIPALFCKCEYCNGVRKRRGEEIRSRAQVLVDGELSIDFPPDAFYHASAFGADFSAIRYLLVTHAHMDHFYAHDFILRGYKYARNLASSTLDIFGNEETLAVFAECTRRELREEIRNTINLHPVKAFGEFSFGGYRVLPLKAKHSSPEPLVYFLEKDGKRVLHLCDTGLLPEENDEYFSRFGGKLDLVNFDCTFLLDGTNENGRHMGVKENAAVFERLVKCGVADESTKKVLTHFSHNSVPTEENLARAEKALGAIAAYDGMEIII